MAARGDTIAAIATAPGKGGVAIVRLSGPEALVVGKRVARMAPTAVGGGARARFSRFHDAAGKVIDEGICLVFRAPRSYTGEDVVELQGHGGSVAPRRVLEACLAAGARLAHRGEFTERAFLNGKLDLSSAERVIELVEARTDRAADDALAHAGRRYDDLYEQVLAVSGELEHALDVDENDLPGGFLSGLEARIRASRAAIERTLSRAHEGRILREGALVVLAGPPNIGKSSLMNALLGTNRAIVSDIPGTTRDSIEECLDIEGWPIRLVDTAGLRETGDAIEAEGVRRSRALMARADLVIELGKDIHPKCDLGHVEGLPNVSAKTGEGMEELKKWIVEKLGMAPTAVGGGAPDGPTPSARETELLGKAARVLADVAWNDPVLAANGVRRAAEALGELTGRIYTEDLLDNLFSRFCVGK